MNTRHAKHALSFAPISHRSFCPGLWCVILKSKTFFCSRSSIFFLALLTCSWTLGSGRKSNLDYFHMNHPVFFPLVIHGHLTRTFVLVMTRFPQRQQPGIRSRWQLRNLVYLSFILQGRNFKASILVYLQVNKDTNDLKVLGSETLENPLSIWI